MYMTRKRMICTIRLYKYIDIVKRNHLSVAQYKVCVFMTSRRALRRYREAKG